MNCPEILDFQLDEDDLQFLCQLTDDESTPSDSCGENDSDNASIMSGQFSGSIPYQSSTSSNLSEYTRWSNASMQTEKFAASSSESNKKSKKRGAEEALFSFSSITDELESKRSKMPKNDFIRFLFSTDIRLSYHRILVDAYNTGNRSHLERSLNSFCIPSCRLSIFTNASKGSTGKKYQDLVGAKNITQYFNAHNMAMPDGVMSTHGIYTNKLDVLPKDFSEYINKLATENKKNKYVLDPNESGEGVVFIVPCSFTGTRVCNIITEQPNRVSDAKKTHLFKSKASQDNLETKISLNFLRIPVPENVHGFTVIALNKESKIARIEMHLSCWLAFSFWITFVVMYDSMQMCR